MRSIRLNRRGLAEIVGTLMLVVIVVAAATAFSFFVAAYQKQLQAEETLNHNKALENLRVLGLTPVHAAQSASVLAGGALTSASPIVGSNALSAVYSAATNAIYMLNYSGSVSVVDPSTYAVSTSTPASAPLPSSADAVAVANGTGGPQIYVAEYDLGAVYCWILPLTSADPCTPSNIPVGQGPDAIAVNSTAGSLYVANRLSDDVSVVNITTGVVKWIQVGAAPAALAEGSGLLYVANAASSNVSVIDEDSGVVNHTIPVGIDPEGIAFDSTTQQLYVANKGSDNLSVINVSSAKRTSIYLGVDSDPWGVLAAGPDVYVADYGTASVSVIAASTGTLLRTAYLGPEAYPTSLLQDTSENSVLVTSSFGESGLARLQVKVASLDVNSMTVSGLTINGSTVTTFTVVGPAGSPLAAPSCLNGNPFAAVNDSCVLALPAESQIYLSFDLNPNATDFAFPAGSDIDLSALGLIQLSFFTTYGNEFTQSFVPPVAIAGVTFVDSNPILDGSNSYQPGTSTGQNVTIVQWSWSVTGCGDVNLTDRVHADCSNYTGQEHELPFPFNSTMSYTIWLNVTSSESLVGSTHIGYTE